jgi:hypothetical protein
MAAADQAAHLVDVEGLLGDEDHVASPGEPGMKGDPACVAPHDLDHHHAVVRLRGGVEAVDRVGRDLERGIEAEGEVRGPEVVVDRLGHAQDRQVVLVVEARGSAERVLAPDRDQAVEVEALERLADTGRAVVALEGVGPRGTQDGPAPREDASGGFDRELLEEVLERSAPAVAKADDGVAVVVDPLADDRPDRGVQPRAVPPSGQHSHAHAAQDTRPSLE